MALILGAYNIELQNKIPSCCISENHISLTDISCLEKDYEEPVEIRFHDMSDGVSLLKITEIERDAQVTPGLDELLAPSAVLAQLPEKSLSSYAPSAMSTQAKKLCTVCGAFILR